MASLATVTFVSDAYQHDTVSSEDMERLIQYLESRAEFPRSIKECMLGLLNNNIARDNDFADDIYALAADDSHDASTLAFMVGTLFRAPRARIGELRLREEDIPYEQSVLMLEEIKAAIVHLLLPSEPFYNACAPARASSADACAVRGLSDFLNLVWRFRYPVGCAPMRGAPWNSAATARALLKSFCCGCALDLHPIALGMLDPCPSSFNRLMALASHVEEAVMLYSRAMASMWRRITFHADHAGRNYMYSARVAGLEPPRSGRAVSERPLVSDAQGARHVSSTPPVPEAFRGGMDGSEPLDVVQEPYSDTTIVARGKTVDNERTDALTDFAEDAVAAGAATDATGAATASDEEEVWYVSKNQGLVSQCRHKRPNCVSLFEYVNIRIIFASDTAEIKKYSICESCKNSNANHATSACEEEL